MKNNIPEMKQFANGDKCWYLNGQLHREDGPAIERANGGKCWYLNGELHRVDGPAIEYANGDKEWYYQDKLMRCTCQSQFEKLLKLRILW